MTVNFCIVFRNYSFYFTNPVFSFKCPILLRSYIFGHIYHGNNYKYGSYRDFNLFHAYSLTFLAQASWHYTVCIALTMTLVTL